MRWGGRWGQPFANARLSPPDPHPSDLSLRGQTPPPPLAADLYFSSRLLLYTFIKSTFRNGNSVGGSTQMLFFFQKQSCSRCLHLFSFWFLPFSFLAIFFFVFFFLRPCCCLYCAYFPEYLKKPDRGDCSFISMMLC